MVRSGWSRPAGGPDHNAIAAPTVDPSLLLSDPLDRDRLWHASTDAKEHASCSFSDGLVVQRATAGSFRCRGPADIEPDNLAAEMNVRLLTKGSCASIWFRFRVTMGYQLRICETQMFIGTHKSAEVEVYKTLPLETPIVIGGPATRIILTVTGNLAQVSRDGTVLGSAPLIDKDITHGKLGIGIFTEPGPAADAYGVEFDHLTVRSLPS
jgi:hypothetical protein